MLWCYLRFITVGHALCGTYPKRCILVQFYYQFKQLLEDFLKPLFGPENLNIIL